MADDRRDAPRHPASLQAQIETEGGRYTIAVTQDVSTTGLLVLSRQPLEVGQRVTIHVLVEGVQHVIEAKVVRQMPLAHDEGALWRSKAAVAVEGSDTQLPKVLEILLRGR